MLDLSTNIISLQQFSISSKLILVAQNSKCRQRKTGIWHTEERKQQGDKERFNFLCNVCYIQLFI